MVEFEAFPKVPRLSRKCTITEKIDGMNAQIIIVPLEELDADPQEPFLYIGDEFGVLAASREKFITVEDDCCGFAKWVEANVQDLLKLGHGRHFGEWWGKGIGRAYGLEENRFSLFNTKRWSDPFERPSCCEVVPVLYEGPFTTEAIEAGLGILAINGSVARPGFHRPEGIMIYHHAANMYFKKTIFNDEAPKSKSQVKRLVAQGAEADL